MLLALTIVSNGITVMASGCPDNVHSNTVLVERIFRHRQKVQEHEVWLDNGLQAVCYVYVEYYDNRYYCNTCNTYFTKTEATSPKHSLSHL